MNCESVAYAIIAISAEIEAIHNADGLNKIPNEKETVDGLEEVIKVLGCIGRTIYLKKEKADET